MIRTLCGIGKPKPAEQDMDLLKPQMVKESAAIMNVDVAPYSIRALCLPQ